MKTTVLLVSVGIFFFTLCPTFPFCSGDPRYIRELLWLLAPMLFYDENYFRIWVKSLIKCRSCNILSILDFIKSMCYYEQKWQTLCSKQILTLCAVPYDLCYIKLGDMGVGCNRDKKHCCFYWELNCVLSRQNEC